MNLTEEDMEQFKEIAYKAMLVPLSRYIQDKGILFNDCTSSEIIAAYINELKSSDERNFELHSEPLEIYENAINASIKINDFNSAALLTAISLEADVNSCMRMGCAVKGYSHKKITKFITEISLATKIDLIFPLLGVEFPEKYKVAIMEFIPYRNSAVHSKMVPEILTNSGEISSSTTKNLDKAKSLIDAYPLRKLKKYSESLMYSIFNISELKIASDALYEHFFNESK